MQFKKISRQAFLPMIKQFYKNLLSSLNTSLLPINQAGLGVKSTYFYRNGQERCQRPQSVQHNSTRMDSVPSKNSTHSKSEFNPIKTANPPLSTPSSTPIPTAITDAAMLELAPINASSPSFPSFPSPSFVASSISNKRPSELLKATNSHFAHEVSQMGSLDMPSSSSISSDIIFSKSDPHSQSLLPYNTPTPANTNIPSASIHVSSTSSGFLSSRFNEQQGLPSNSLSSLQSALFTKQSQRHCLLFDINFQLRLPAEQALPNIIPFLTPSDPSILFDGLSTIDEHVTVWQPSSGKTVAGNAAPYRRNLTSWLHNHPGWEEKSDEHKSSKRRSAARRSRSVALAFAAACCYPAAVELASKAGHHYRALSYSNERSTMSTMAADEFVGLQELLVKATQEIHKNGVAKFNLSSWSNISEDLGDSKLEATVVYVAYFMLMRGIAKSLAELENVVSSTTLNEKSVSSSKFPESVVNNRHPVLPENVGTIAPPDALLASLLSGKVEYPVHGSSCNNIVCDQKHENDIFLNEKSSTDSGVNSCHQTACNMKMFSLAKFLDERAFTVMPAAPAGAAAVLERIRTHREPRVTVWNPTNRRTISGNAAPCRRNLKAWMEQHPGWVPKEEGQLSSSRRNRNRSKGQMSIVHSPPSTSGPTKTIMPVSPINNYRGSASLNEIAGRYMPSTITANERQPPSGKRIPLFPSPEAGNEPQQDCQALESSAFHDALKGLMDLSRSPAKGNSDAHDEQLDDANGTAPQPINGVQDPQNHNHHMMKEKPALISTRHLGPKLVSPSSPHGGVPSIHGGGVGAHDGQTEIEDNAIESIPSSTDSISSIEEAELCKHKTELRRLDNHGGA